MSGYNQPCSSNGHHMVGRENPKVIGTPISTSKAYPTTSMEHQQRARLDTMPDDMETAGQSGYQVYPGESDAQYAGKSRVHTTLYGPSKKPNQAELLVPVHSITPLYPWLQQKSGAYTPLQRWEQETFREQPWHGIARELMVDSARNETASGEENGEDMATSPCMDERRKNAAKPTAENNCL